MNGKRPSYLKSAIARIYGDDDDFILLGLTGRTGSGCSTAAKILQSDRDHIKHSLFTGAVASSSDARKERIVDAFFRADWKPFLLIQVRAHITTFLLERSNSEATDFLKDILTQPQAGAFQTVLQEIRDGQDRLNDSKISAAEFYSSFLPEKSDALKSALGENEFVRVYQRIGRNIRLSGSAYSDELVAGKFFSLAERINDCVKRIRAEHHTESERTFIVIDAIRNPLEALFFQDRYASFFLMAVSAPEDHRVRRLRALRYSQEDIDRLNKAEYTARDFDEEEFYSVQDIQGCLQRADIYVSNPDDLDEVSKHSDLAKQLIRFVSLIRRPGIVTPTAVERCMQIAHTAKLNSGCISRQVGVTCSPPAVPA